MSICMLRSERRIWTSSLWGPSVSFFWYNTEAVISSKANHQFQLINGFTRELNQPHRWQQHGNSLPGFICPWCRPELIRVIIQIRHQMKFQSTKFRAGLWIHRGLFQSPPHFLLSFLSCTLWAAQIQLPSVASNRGLGSQLLVYDSYKHLVIQDLWCRWHLWSCKFCWASNKSHQVLPNPNRGDKWHWTHC